MKYKRRYVVLLIATFILGEIIARLAYPAPLSYAEAVTAPLRLWTPNQRAVFDIRDLYEGADRLAFNTTEHGFIAPEPLTQDILFLGGSTTEALYVPEDRRWTAQLGGYNAAQSGANSIDELRVFQDITGHGYRFKLVVLATQVNDFNWLHRLGRMDASTYDADLRAYNVATDTRPPLVKASRLALLIDNLLRPGEKNVTRAYLTLKQSYVGTVHSGRDCELPDVATYRRYETQNLKLFNEAVIATGAKLLVMSEASSYGAPPASFKTDLRSPMNCGEADYYAQAARAWTAQSAAYLAAARDAGALTFDLSAAMGIYTNGPEGGKYQYDDVHYTPLGSDKVAEILKPVIRDVLTIY